MLPSSFRAKFFQVQEELTSSLRTLVLSEPSSPLVIPSRHGKHFEGIRLDAGADILNHYQFQWCRIRETSDQNFRAAEQADKALHSLVDYINQQHYNASTLLNSLSSVASITSQLQKLGTSLGETEKLLLETEEKLVTLEELVKDVDLENKMDEYRTKTSHLREQKFLEFEKLKAQLAQEHSLKIKEHEVKQMIRAQERQAIFAEAFETEIQQYKQSGIIPKKSISQQETLSLEEVVVDDDPSNLNEFLEDC